MTDEVETVVQFLASKGASVGRRTATEIITTAMSQLPPGQSDLVITVTGSDGGEASVTASEIRGIVGGGT
jgi:hypothetical protein